MRPMPLTPCVSWLQKASTPIPIGETTPRPVTTTRLIRAPRCCRLRCTSGRLRELAPPQIQNPVPRQETLDEWRVKDAIANEFDLGGRDPYPSQLSSSLPDVGEFAD